VAGSGEPGQQCAELLPRHHDRQPRRPARVHHFSELLQRLVKHLGVKKLQRSQRLVLNRRAHPRDAGQMRAMPSPRSRPSSQGDAIMN
jgi:hypothetical protein